MKQHANASRAIVLGRGIDRYEQHGDVTWRLSPASLQRAEAMLRYYRQHSTLFRRYGSLIVCSGGYAGVAKHQQKPPEGVSEGGGVADYLVRNGVPTNLVEAEKASVSTFDNFVQCLRTGYFPQDQPFTTAEPLMIGASSPHGKRRGIPIARAAYGVEDKKGIVLLRGERESPLAIARERIGGIATRIALAEVEVPPFDSTLLSEAGNRFEELAIHPAQLVRAAVQHYTPTV